LEDFKSIIIKFAEQGASFDDLEAEIVKLAENSPDASNDLLKVLVEAKEEGLIADSQYNHILTSLVAAHTITATDTGAKEDSLTVDPRQFFSQTGLQKLETVGPGTIIKERFELLDVLGEGGMGMVYKARDLIKVEAKDRNPYLAIKVLNDNFKQHPESFIALQRECSRTQKLAHPNIATVYDFDRYGSMIYMTMQLLEGKPLNDFIKDDVPEGGLSFEEVFPMIEDMANALTYAHSQDIVHSDFKPGNSFITKDHGVQVLDFGIARAIKRPGQDATLFDAGKLGALTPAYASCEMLEEEEPDPRDDIFALAVVSYILLSGEHPFDKFPATLARDHGMEAKPIKKLTRAQNKALQRGLSFYRDDCTPTAREFMEELRGKADNTVKYLLAGIASIIVLGLLAIYPVQNYLQEKREDEVVQLLSSKDATVVEKTLAGLEERKGISVETVLSRSRDGLMGYYSQQVDSALSGKQGPNNFRLAYSLIEEVRQWYPQAEQVKQLSAKVQQRKARIINFIDSTLNQIVEEHDVNAAGAAHSVPELFDTLRKVEPGNALRKDVRIPLIYADMIDQAIADKRMLDADDLLKQATVFYPDNADIQFLQSELNRYSDASYTATKKQKKADELAREKRQKERQQALDAAVVEAAKRSIIHQSAAGHPDKAIETLNKLKGLLPADALFLTDIAPKVIGESYLKLAAPLAQAGQIDRAIELIQAGLQVAPDDAKLMKALEKYQGSVGL
jgi:serine/threonine protein kinase